MSDDVWLDGKRMSHAEAQAILAPPPKGGMVKIACGVCGEVLGHVADGFDVEVTHQSDSGHRIWPRRRP